MKYLYCETCKIISVGYYNASNDMNIQIYHCTLCDALTALTPEDYMFDFYEHDIKLRREGVNIMNRIYKKALKK